MSKLKNMFTRFIGVILFAFIPGMASGAATGIGPVLGGLNGVATVVSSIIIYFGVQLAWDANISDQDIEKGFRAAVAKQAEDNPDVKAALATSADDTIDFEDFDFGDVEELDHTQPAAEEATQE